MNGRARGTCCSISCGQAGLQVVFVGLPEVDDAGTTGGEFFGEGVEQLLFFGVDPVLAEAGDAFDDVAVDRAVFALLVMRDGVRTEAAVDRVDRVVEVGAEEAVVAVEAAFVEIVFQGVDGAVVGAGDVGVERDRESDFLVFG